jgi:hypothetical protein
MERNHPKTKAVTIYFNKQFYAMVFFVITFIGASYYTAATTPAKLRGLFLLLIYSTSHRKQQPPQTPTNTRTGQCCKIDSKKFYSPEPTDKSTN